MHFVLNQLLCVKNGELVGVEDQLLDATLFLLITNWYTPIKEYICKGYFEDDVPREKKKCLTIKSIPYRLYGKKLNKLGPNGILWQCLSHTEANVILIKLHDGLAGGHYGISMTIKKILTKGY